MKKKAKLLRKPLIIIFVNLQNVVRRFILIGWLLSFHPKLLRYLKKSKAQLLQDLFALAICGDEFPNYFVEFGATNGISLSNSFLLESNFGWTGLVAEPAKIWQSDLRKNRSCLISDLCIWTQSGVELEFLEATKPELSGLKNLGIRDKHEDRAEKSTYKVKTITLNELLKFAKSPNNIGLLSIDTEGTELEILRSIDFETYQFSVIVCEHNYSEHRNEIVEFLSGKGYKRVLRRASGWDDWFVSSRAS